VCRSASGADDVCLRRGELLLCADALLAQLSALAEFLDAMVREQAVE
jgi:hypothetical protein